MTTPDKIHADALLKAAERQRNDALNREVHKDALIAMLQGQIKAIKGELAAVSATGVPRIAMPGIKLESGR